MNAQNHTTLRCKIVGIGAWGPGFNNWSELTDRLNEKRNSDLPAAITPKPGIIPANERRRSPLPVKIAVETSWQATQDSGIAPKELACVFGSGLGDTEITDYMCRVLTTELKQLSPTKFHNSVHNAAAGYWTISTQSMKSANSIAAYHETAGLALLEAASQCIQQNEPVLISLFDTKAHKVYREIFENDLPFSASIVLAPATMETPKTIVNMNMKIRGSKSEHSPIKSAALQPLYEHNPAAKILFLFEALTEMNTAHSTPISTSTPLSQTTSLELSIEPAHQS